MSLDFKDFHNTYNVFGRISKLAKISGNAEQENEVRKNPQADIYGTRKNAKYLSYKKYMCA